METNVVRVLFIICFFTILNNPVYGQYTFGLTDDESGNTGYLKPVIAEQDSFYVVINHNFDQALRIASGDSIEVSTGPVHLRYVKQYYIDVQQNVDVEKNTVHRVGTRLIPVRGDELRSRRSSYPRIFWGSNNFVLTDPETDLYVDGEFAGTHYITVDTTRSFTVTGVHPSGKRFEGEFSPEREAPFNYHQHFAKPLKSKSRYLSFIPGASQFYKGQTVKGLAVSALALTGAAMIVSYETKYQGQMDSYHRLNDEYLASRNPEEAFLLGNRAEAAFDNAVGFSQTRNRLIYGTALLYVANIIDGFLAPSIGFRDDSRAIDPYLDFDPVYRQPLVGVKSNF